MKEERSVSFLKGTLSLSLSVILTKVLGVAFKVPLSYVLGDEGMGYFNTAYAIYGLFYILCTAGVPKSLALVLSEERTYASDNRYDRYILRTALSIFAVVGIFSTLFNIICAPALASAVGNGKASLSIIAVAPSILFVSLSGVLRGYLNSSEKLTEIAVSQLIEGGVKLGLGLALAFLGVSLGLSVSAISALAILGITIGSMLSFIYMSISIYSRKTDNNKGQNIYFDARRIKRSILKNALPITLSSTLLNLSSSLDVTLIIKGLTKNGMSEAHANSIYGNYTTLAVPMFNLVIAVLAPIATSYMPRLANHHISDMREEFSSELNRLLWITLIVSVPASLAFYFYSFDILDVLFSVQSSAVGAEMLTSLSFGVSCLAVLTVANTALEAQRRIKATVFSLLIGCAVKFVLSYFLIRHSAIGILGAPIGTVISYFVSLCVSVLFLEGSGVRLHIVSRTCLLYLIGLSVFYSSYRYIYSESLAGTSFASMIISAGVASLAYFALLAPIYLAAKKKWCLKCTKKNIEH